MAEFSIRIDGEQVKEIRCKNDSCRKLICYESVKVGLLIFVCPRCNQISKFRIGYQDVKKQFIDKLEKQFVKGGEK